MQTNSLTTNQLYSSLFVEIAKSAYQQRTQSIGLIGGKMGLCINLFHLARYTENTEIEKLAEALIDEIYKGIYEDTPIFFATGLGGIAWGLEYLAQHKWLDLENFEALQETNTTTTTNDSPSNDTDVNGTTSNTSTSTTSNESISYTDTFSGNGCVYTPSDYQGSEYSGSDSELPNDNILEETGILIKGDDNKFYKYKEGNLYDAQQNLYRQEITGSLLAIFTALKKIRVYSVASKVITKLEKSHNQFIIETFFKSDCTPTNGNKAVFCTYIKQAKSNGISIDYPPPSEIGSGAKIRWCTNGSTLSTLDGMRNNPTIVLIHELFHAYDSDTGFWNTEKKDDLPLNEWQASYRENKLRQEMKEPLRDYYNTNQTDTRGEDPRLLDSNNQPICPDGYEL